MKRLIGGESRRGQSILELSLILPLLLLLIVNTVNFGAFFYAWITVSNAARTGVQYMVLGGASIGGGGSVNSTTIVNLIKQNDVLSLIDNANVQVTTCTDNQSGGTDVYKTTVVAASAGGCTTGGFVDPRPASYVIATVDVTYTYQPIIPVWNFPRLGIHATLPPTTIHRKAVMRMIQ
jgi:Flp pilus assembly protein TadG